MSTTTSPPPWRDPSEHLCADVLPIAAAACRAPLAGLFATGPGRLSLLGGDGDARHLERELREMCRETAEAGEPVVLNRPRGADGRGVRGFVGVPIRFDDGRSVCVLLVADTGYREFLPADVRALAAVALQVERRFEDLRSAHAVEVHNWVASVARHASDLRMALRACVTAVCEHDGWPIGHIAVPAGPGDDTLVSTDLWHCLDESRCAALREAVERVWRASGPGAWRGATASGGVRRGEPADEPTTTTVLLGDQALSCFALPVRANGELVAVVEFFDVERRGPSRHLRDVARGLARELGVAATRIRDREALEHG
ncbi:GAF domain-containing protein [Saccharothrix sp.]|uniref:GAF domain-containing protein n=1 Tax=Saccharothrix sp. TaxID=1873460 RepID=UPI002811C679|nr:GAF domain-containing protein [Saccharothrix sp.]